ncbi:hypothetical protein KC345_g10099 [Hortaea werneckii]|nr:hypothetical protein KC345_g10099 [Hortaea werneckii]
MKSVPGVADVQTVGGANKGYVVTLRMKDLVASGMSIDDFNKSIALDIPSMQGNVANVKASFPIRIEDWDLTEQQLNGLNIKNKDGDSVSLSDVASVSQSLTDVKTVSRTNGKASVLINVVKTPTATITDVAAHVKDRVSGISAVKSGDVSMTLLTDRAHDLNSSLMGLLREGLLGCLFSMICVLFFFRNIRSTLLIAVSLPISLLATVAILKWMGVTLNILTVSGLIVAMGRIVDDAIVILDNIYRRVQENKVFAARLPFSLLPSTASGQVAIKVELPKGTPLSEVDKEVKAVEDILHNNTRIASYSSTFGSSFTPQADDVFDQGGGYIQQPNVANLSIQLKNVKEVDSVISALRSDLSGLSDRAAITVTNQNIAGDDSTINIMLMGADEQTLEKAADQVRAKLVDVPGLSVSGKTDMTNGVPKFAVVMDREKVKQAGIKENDINSLLKRYMTKGKDFDILTSTGTGVIPVDVYIDPVQSKPAPDHILPVYTPEQVLASLAAETLSGSNGQSYRLDQVASIHQSDAVSSIQERDVSKAVDQALKNTPLPDGVTYSLGGITQQVTQMIIEMTIAVVISILLVLLITSMVFKGWKAPFAVLISIPLALSGVVIALYAIHGQWNLAALIGVLMLTDTVISQVLGIVVIGGMVTSTLNSFVVIPIIYEWMQGKAARNAEHSMTGKTV